MKLSTYIFRPNQKNVLAGGADIQSAADSRGNWQWEAEEASGWAHSRAGNIDWTRYEHNYYKERFL